MKASLLVGAVGAVAALAGCAGPAPGGTVTVLAAASLGASLDEVAADFEAEHPGIDVVISFGGSSALAEQILSGSPADVFFAADEATMRSVTDAGLATSPEVLLANTLQLVVPAGNPANVTGLADLADARLTVALCDPSVPCGSAALRLLDLAGVAASPDTLEPDVTAALTRVALGEADAALVYRTDVLAAGDSVEGIDVPEADGVVNRYPIALLAAASDPEAARAFLEFVRGPEGMQVFLDAGFVAP